jgi:hypothetical protein
MDALAGRTRGTCCKSPDLERRHGQSHARSLPCPRHLQLIDSCTCEEIWRQCRSVLGPSPPGAKCVSGLRGPDELRQLCRTCVSSVAFLACRRTTARSLTLHATARSLLSQLSRGLASYVQSLRLYQREFPNRRHPKTHRSRNEGVNRSYEGHGAQTRSSDEDACAAESLNVVLWLQIHAA